MGVHGLIPFIRKVCPEVIKVLPNRFRDVSGKHIVIDGTLITQRFHFSPSTHPYRHVLGWYRVIEEMRQSGVVATCVFDGKGRHSAKRKEVMRRRENQKLLAARGHIEEGRLQRLDFLKSYLSAIPTLPVATVVATLQDFENLGVKKSRDPEVQEALETLDAEATDDTLVETLKKVDVTEDGTVQGTSDPQESTENALSEPTPEHPSVTVVESPSSAPELSDPAEMRATLGSMYDDFKRSLPQLATIVRSEGTPASDAEDATSTAPPDIDNIMTKAQAHLAVKEKELWDKLPSVSTQDEEGLNDLTGLAGNLVMESYDMSTSFNRRTNLPTSQTYQECLEILEALGVRCIMSEGEVEAEGLASAIALCGKADYVASEDTDVLVYGAPLLRNFANNQVPLEVISADGIQTALELDDKTYLDFALLLGTDFSQRLKNVGPVRALQFIKAHQSIERVIECESKYPPRMPQEEYLQEVDAARKVFGELPPLPEMEDGESNGRDEEAVAEVLDRYGLSDVLQWGSWNPDTALAGNYFEDNPAAIKCSK